LLSIPATRGPTTEKELFAVPICRVERTTLEKELAARLFYLLVHLKKADTLLFQQATYYQEATIIVAGKPTTVTTGKLTVYQTLGDDRVIACGNAGRRNSKATEFHQSSDLRPSHSTP